MSLKSKLDNLTIEQRRKLMHAFDMHISQHVELSDAHFIGVNIIAPSFKILERVGVWSYGQLT